MRGFARLLPLVALPLLAGCYATRNHFILAARADMAAPPVIPALNTSDSNGYQSLGVRLATRDAPNARLQTRLDGDTTGNSDIYHSSPGNYSVRRTRVDAGVDIRAVFNRHFDFFLSGNVNASNPKQYASGLMGFGVTFTTPWVDFRLAPAGGFHRYRTSVRDSIVDDIEGPFIDDFDTSYVKTARDRYVDPVGAFSFSLWLPKTLTGSSWTPYVQYQYQTIYLSSSRLSQDALTVDGSVWTAGLNWDAARWLGWNLSMARETLSNDHSHAANYRAESGLEFKFRD